MLGFKSTFQKITKSQLQVIGVLFLILLAVGLLWFNSNNSVQAEVAMVAQVYFEGEYRIADGEWQKIEEGVHIPSTKGDVTLRGNLHRLTPDGEYIGIFRGDLPIMFYADHLQLTIYDGENGFSTNDMENPLCGESWSAHYFMCPEDQTIEIVIQNPHKFGNETAIDEMLSRLAIQDELRLYEKNALSSGETQRNIGLLFIIASVMLLGIALFSTLIHIKNSKIIWAFGGLVLFAGLYFTYGADGVFLWGDSIASNTTILGASMMFYMFFLSIIIAYLLVVTRRFGKFAVILLGFADAIFLCLPVVSNVLFYDTWVWWSAVQIIVNIVLAVCLIKELNGTSEKERLIYIGAFLSLIAFVGDVFGTGLAVWKGGLISQYVFVVLFVVAMIMVLKLIPHNINAAAKAKELELEKIALNAELTESRVSTMMSQIRPHFIYNTLGSIEQLCKFDPPKAGELVHNFAKYLRGNFGELDNPKPILMSQEMEHVHHYISIENVRFPDMTFTFEMNSEDFHIPALTVQPIVENAIKHGLMKLPKGGTIRVVSYETDKDYCISVVDDGVGFDTNALLDDRQHVGLRNIRERLKVMVNGTLEIESTIGVGTKVLIKIPKEARK